MRGFCYERIDAGHIAGPGFGWAPWSGEEDGTNSKRRKAVFIVRLDAAADEGVKVPAAVWGCAAPAAEESPTEIMYNQPTHPRASI